MAEEPETTDTMVAALLREREGYAARGMKDRVAQVDEQLKHRGYKPRGSRQSKPAANSTPPADGKKAEDEQRAQPPQGRTQQTPDRT
jgi:hypothetical protein